jgi:hypothetical protein
MEELSKHVKEVEMLRDNQKFLGMNFIVVIDNNCVTVNHEQYIVDRYSTFNNKDAIRTPMLQTTNLRSADSNPNNESLILCNSALHNNIQCFTSLSQDDLETSLSLLLKLNIAAQYKFINMQPPNLLLLYQLI